MQKRDRAPLLHMLDAARKAVSLAKGRSRKDLDRELTLNLSLVRLLEVWGHFP